MIIMRNTILFTVSIFSLVSCNTVNIDESIYNKKRKIEVEKMFLQASMKDYEQKSESEKDKILLKQNGIECDEALVNAYERASGEPEVKFDKAKPAFIQCWKKYDAKVISITPTSHELERSIKE